MFHDVFLLSQESSLLVTKINQWFFNKVINYILSLLIIRYTNLFLAIAPYFILCYVPLPLKLLTGAFFFPENLSGKERMKISDYLLGIPFLMLLLLSNIRVLEKVPCTLTYISTINTKDKENTTYCLLNL